MSIDQVIYIIMVYYSAFWAIWPSAFMEYGEPVMIPPSMSWCRLYIWSGAKAAIWDPPFWLADKVHLDFTSVRRPEFSRPPIITGQFDIFRTTETVWSGGSEILKLSTGKHQEEQPQKNMVLRYRLKEKMKDIRRTRIFSALIVCFVLLAEGRHT
jgi:hypothetical protein